MADLLCLTCPCCGLDVFAEDLDPGWRADAKSLGVYRALWSPEKEGLGAAEDLLRALESAQGGEVRSITSSLARLLDGVTEACRRWPEASVKVWR